MKIRRRKAEAQENNIPVPSSRQQCYTLAVHCLRNEDPPCGTVAQSGLAIGRLDTG